jgi:hypothetical protein
VAIKTDAKQKRYGQHVTTDDATVYEHPEYANEADDDAEPGRQPQHAADAQHVQLVDAAAEPRAACGLEDCSGLASLCKVHRIPCFLEAAAPALLALYLYGVLVDHREGGGL